MAQDQEFFRERARKAAEARWGKERVYKRIEAIAAGFRAANPKLTEAAAISRAVQENPALYAEYVAAASNQPQLTHEEMVEAYQQEVRDLCALAGKAEMARQFIKARTHPRDVLKFLLATKGAER